MIEKVLIITLNYNQNDYTLKCIDSLLNSTYVNFNILLIDNGSSEENYQLLESALAKDSRIILIRIIQNRGYVGGINFGLEEGIKLNPDYFLIMNNDTIIDKHAISELISASKDYKNNAIVSGKVYHYNEPNKLQLIGIKIIDKKLLLTNQVGVDEIDCGQYENILEFDLLDDIFWLVPKNLFLEIGGYSPNFWFNYEQEDFALRAKDLGYKLIFTPKAKIWHKGSPSIGGREFNPNQAYWTMQSSLILKYIHLKKIYFLNYYFKAVVSIIRTFIKSIYLKLKDNKNNFPYAKAKLQGLLYFNKWVLKKNINTGYNPFNK